MESTSSDDVGNDDAVKNQDNTLTLRFIEKSIGDMAGEKIMNCCEQPTEKKLRASASKILNNTVSLEKVVSPVFRIKTKVWTTDASSGAMNLKDYNE